LKVAKHKNKQDSSDESEEENLSLLSKKFIKFLKRNRNKESNKERYGNKKTRDFNSNKYTCFGCGEQGHRKDDCPNKEGKEKKSRNKEKKGKSKRAFIAWDENKVSSSSSSSSEDEKANMCLMAEGDDDSSNSSSVSSCASLNAENYSQLLQAFKETLEEANRWALLNNRVKGLNNWLENSIKSLEKELEKSKPDLENLEMHCKNSSHLYDSKVCENCKALEGKVHYLVITVDKLSNGKLIEIK